jgi:hypothetical protein
VEADQRFDYTAIGDAVNIAARLESATKERAVNIINRRRNGKVLWLSIKRVKIY